MVWQVAQAVKIPVVGLGGIMGAEDAIEFLLAGASAIQVGTANFIDPQISVKIVEGIEKYMQQQGIEDVKDLIGGMIV
jgi:dihydroorotate dehydrogenase (NAD+) catalytic subunit